MHKPIKTHLNIAMSLLWYLKGSRRKGVTFLKNDKLDLKDIHMVIEQSVYLGPLGV